jgi:hypothetical protein
MYLGKSYTYFIKKDNRKFKVINKGSDSFSMITGINKDGNCVSQRSFIQDVRKIQSERQINTSLNAMKKHNSKLMPVIKRKSNVRIEIIDGIKYTIIKKGYKI